MRVKVIGAGYVELVTATCLAELGYRVMCVEKLSSKLKKLRQGISPIYEPGLTKMLEKNLAAKRLLFTNHAADGADFSEIIFIYVGTQQSETGKADLS